MKKSISQLPEPLRTGCDGDMKYILYPNLSSMNDLGDYDILKENFRPDTYIYILSDGQNTLCYGEIDLIEADGIKLLFCIYKDSK